MHGGYIYGGTVVNWFNGRYVSDYWADDDTPTGLLSGLVGRVGGRWAIPATALKDTDGQNSGVGFSVWPAAKASASRRAPSSPSSRSQCQSRAAFPDDPREGREGIPWETKKNASRRSGPPFLKNLIFISAVTLQHSTGNCSSENNASTALWAFPIFIASKIFNFFCVYK